LQKMAAHYYNTEHVHPYSWDQVAEAIFQRYPNPFARHVLSEDTVHRELLTGGTLYTRRFITKTNKVPSWGEKYLSRLARKVPLMEESFIDTKEKIITLYTRSVGFGAFMTATEKVVYQADPDNPDHTVAVKSAWVESSFYGLRSAIKNFGIERFKKNCVKATEGFNHVLERFHRQQTSLRELGTVKLAEFQVKKDLLREGVTERVESMKERGLHIKEEVTEKVEHMKEGVTEKVEHMRERSREMKERAKETAELTAKEVTERVKANATLHAAED